MPNCLYRRHVTAAGRVRYYPVTDSRDLDGLPTGHYRRRVEPDEGSTAIRYDPAVAAGIAVCREAMCRAMTDSARHGLSADDIVAAGLAELTRHLTGEPAAD